MIKRKMVLTLVCIMIAISLMGCSKGNSIEQYDEQQNEQIIDVNAEKMSQENQSSDNTNVGTDENIDIDLTELSSTMVYSEVYNIVMAPDDYIGKTIRMRGIFKTYPSEDSDKTYFAVVILDATACCEQGFEFIWKGEHNYPEDYPVEDTEVEISGVLDTYEEDGYEYFYVMADEFIVISEN